MALFFETLSKDEVNYMEDCDSDVEMINECEVLAEGMCLQYKEVHGIQDTEDKKEEEVGEAKGTGEKQTTIEQEPEVKEDVATKDVATKDVATKEGESEGEDDEVEEESKETEKYSGSSDLVLYLRVFLDECVKSQLVCNKQISRYVYQVTRIQDKKPLCLKIVGESRDRLPMELRVLSFLRSVKKPSKYVQRLDGLFLHKHYYAFLSDYAPHMGAMAKELQSQPLVIRDIIQQLLFALQFIHKKKVIHRDIKLSNMLWDGKKLTLIDFGFATWNTQVGHHIKAGTAGFQAPETFAYERDYVEQVPINYDFKIDIYSAGAVLGCLLFGMNESQTSELTPLLFKHQASKILPPHTADILTQMLHTNPALRPNARELLLHPYFKKDGADVK